MTAITKIDSSRQREIAQVLLQQGWDYMRQILTLGKVKQIAGDGNKSTLNERVDIPPPEIIRSILVDLGPVYVKLGQLLSTRPDLLPPDYITALSDLQATVARHQAQFQTQLVKGIRVELPIVKHELAPARLRIGYVSPDFRCYATYKIDPTLWLSRGGVLTPAPLC
jgi:ubiquinone biosynthesis protein